MGLMGWLPCSIPATVLHHAGVLLEVWRLSRGDDPVQLAVGQLVLHVVHVHVWPRGYRAVVWAGVLPEATKQPCGQPCGRQAASWRPDVANLARGLRGSGIAAFEGGGGVCVCMCVARGLVRAPLPGVANSTPSAYSRMINFDCQEQAPTQASPSTQHSRGRSSGSKHASRCQSPRVDQSGDITSWRRPRVPGVCPLRF